MHKPIKHRWHRWLRWAAVGALLCRDAVAPWSALPIYADSVDSISIGVIPISTALPASITDLVASANPAVEGQVSITWSAPQGNAGGFPIPNQPVAAYIIHYATFSVASLAGDTTSWWNATYSSESVLSPPSYVPKAPGQLESYGYTGLTPGSTVYFGVKSISQGGITSLIDTKSQSPFLQAKAVVTKFPVASSGTPMRPTGLSATSGNGQFKLMWHPVVLDTNKQPININHYVLYRYDSVGSSPTISAVVTPADLSYTDTLTGPAHYYRVLAVSQGNISSALSDYVDSTVQMNHISVADDDNQTRVVVPDALARELNADLNTFGQDLEIKLTRRSSDEIDLTLRSYHVGVYRTQTGEEIAMFAFSASGMQVQLGLGASLGSPPLNTLMSRATGGSIAQIVSVYWNNGSAYMRISDPTLTSNSSLSVSVRNVGTYQVRVVQISTQFQLLPNSPYPRVITPNDASQNNRVFWFFDNPGGDTVSGTIYNIRGQKIRDLSMNSQSPTSNSIVWDGRDNSNAVVRSGVYIYKITAGKEKVTGTVVVAR